MVVDQSTPSCGNSRFGCWTCTVVDRDKAGEGLLESGDGRGVARIVSHFNGVPLPEPAQNARLSQLQEEVTLEKGISANTLRRMLAKVEEFSESNRIRGLNDDLLNILKDDLFAVEAEAKALAA